MKNANVWECSEGCDLSKGVICPHLEALLPSMRDKKLQRVPVENMSMDVFTAYRPSFDLGAFQELMRNYGFIDPWDMQLLTCKYFHGMSNRQITKEQNFCSPRTTDRRLKALHALLKERGFEQEYWSWLPKK